MERPPPARSETSIARKVGRRILQLIHAELSGEGSEVEFENMQRSLTALGGAIASTKKPPSELRKYTPAPPGMFAMSLGLSRAHSEVEWSLIPKEIRAVWVQLRREIREGGASTDVRTAINNMLARHPEVLEASHTAVRLAAESRRSMASAAAADRVLDTILQHPPAEAAGSKREQPALGEQTSLEPDTAPPPRHRLRSTKEY